MLNINFIKISQNAIYDPTGTILAILYREVPHMLHAKYQPNQGSDSGEEVL